MNQRNPLDILVYEERRLRNVANSDPTIVGSGSKIGALITGIIESGLWVPIGRIGITPFGEFRLSNRSTRLVATRRYSFINNAVTGDDLGAAEMNKDGNALEALYVILSDIMGVAGYIKSTHVNATAISGQKALTVSRGILNTGDTVDGWMWVVIDQDFTLNDAAIADGTITLSTTNYFFLKRDGTWAVRTTNTPPAQTLIAFSAVFGATDATSVNNNPTGRKNLLSLDSINTKLAQQTALTAANAGTIDTTWDSTEVAIMGNMRTRINELETRLHNMGVLP